MPKTISTTITSSYTLTVNPTTVTDAGAVSASTGAAIYGPGGTAWTVNNSGRIQAASSGTAGAGPNGFGVDLTAGGAVTNASGGTIAGRVGVGVAGASATISNAGSATIAGGYDGITVTASTTVAVYNAGTISGNSYIGIDVAGSTVLTNMATGLIEGDASFAYGGGAVLRGSSETVQNAGTIESLGSHELAINLLNGTGYLSNASGGLVLGSYDGIDIGNGAFGGAGTIVNTGSIGGIANNGAFLGHGGTVTNNSGGIISGKTDGVVIWNGNRSVINQGLITASQGDAINLNVGTIGSVYVSNASTGTISGGGIGVQSTGAVLTVVNAGTITSPNFGIDGEAGGSVTNTAHGRIAGYDGIKLKGAGASVTNAGSIVGGTAKYSDGVYLPLGGTVTNAATAGITAAQDGIFIKGAAGTVVNDGAIQNSLSHGYDAAVDLFSGGQLNNAVGATISGNGIGVYGGKYAPVTVTNAGTVAGGAAAKNAGIALVGGGAVSNGGTIRGAYGVALDAGGSVTNTASAVIQGGLDNAVIVTGGAGTVSNAGSITNTGIDFSAIYFHNGGSIDNAAGGLISSTYHAIDAYGATTVTNAGRITNDNPSNSAIDLNNGGTVANAAGGVIASSYHAIYIAGGGTVTNAGTIDATGANTIAIELIGGSANRLIVDPGAVFGGTAIGSGAASTLELAPGTGTLAGIGSAITNFSAIAFDPGAAWDVSGVLAGFGGSVTGFAPGDTIHLTDVVANSGTYAAGRLDLFNSGSPVGHISMSGSFTADKFTVDPVNGITVACFVEGTRLLTDAGEIEVERLAPGARVFSVPHRKFLPAIWIGHRWLREASPVRVCAGAFGAGEPHRDLWLSPDHAVFVDKLLIPVRYLINGATIVQQRRDLVCYFHVELAAHGVLLAEGLPAESYLDTGNRSAFANGGGAVQMNPDFARAVWQRQACAKLVVDGAAVVAVRERLHARAKQLGWATTDAPAPLLLMHGQRIAPHTTGDDFAKFLLPCGSRHAALLSRATIAAHVQPRSADHRRLGLAVAALALDGAEVPLDDARLGAGWHAPEPGLRWTDGAARIALAGERTLTVRFARLLRYWAERATA